MNKIANKNRNLTIDLLRALAMLSMFYLHVTALYLNRPGMDFFWDIGHFSVPLFVFCSGYVHFLRTNQWQNFSLTAYLIHIKKRLARLLIPYYIFLLSVFASLFLLQPHLLTTDYVLHSLLLIGGVDISWLILLFVILTLLTPLYLWFRNKYSPVLRIYQLIAIVSALTLFYIKPEIDYRFYFWLPWSAIFIYPVFMMKHENDRIYLFGKTIFSIVPLIGLFYILYATGRPTGLYIHKYPPDAYYFSYGLTILHLIYLTKPLSKIGSYLLNEFLIFISVNSYPLFFIHWLVIYYLSNIKLQNYFGWPLFLILVILISLFIQSIINRLTQYFSAMIRH